MSSRSVRTAAVVLLTGGIVTAGPAAAMADPVTYVRPGAPGEASQVGTYEEIFGEPLPDTGVADVRFMQRMIPHHGQALEMVALLPSDASDATTSIAQRIEISQRSEINQMQGWLADRGHEVPGAHGDHHSGMPGMASEAEMAALGDASGGEFDRLFLELMIPHHQGALIMVQDLRDSGAVLDAETAQLANHIYNAQNAEIAAMKALLDDLEAS